MDQNPPLIIGAVRTGKVWWHTIKQFVRHGGHANQISKHHDTPSLNNIFLS